MSSFHVHSKQAHGAVASSYMNLCKHYTSRGSFLLGLSATPVRLDPTESLGRVFHTLIKGPSVSQLIKSGALVPPRVLLLDNVSARTPSISLGLLSNSFLSFSCHAGTTEKGLGARTSQGKAFIKA